MRILWQSFVDEQQNKPYLDRLGAWLNAAAAPGTRIDVVGLSPPDRDFSRLTELRCAILAIDRCIAAEAQGYDCFVLGHFQDPGLYEARSSVRIPVIGAGESSLHFAAQLGRRIGLISIDAMFDVYHREQADRYGLGERIVGVAGMECVAEDFRAAFADEPGALDRLVEIFDAAAAPLVARGADVIIPAGILPAMLLAGRRELKVREAPVVNSAAVALKAAEMGVEVRRLTGVEPSRISSFPLAPAGAIADFRRLVAQGRDKG